MSGTLIKKALRDIRRHLGAYLACAMLMAIGVLFYSAMTQVAANLPLAQQSFYKDYRFADAFATVNALPNSRVARLNALPGIEKASGRLVASARVVKAEDDETVELKLISYDPEESDRLNNVSITKGSAPKAGSYSVLLNELFYQENGLSEGDEIEIALLGRRVRLTVAGSVQTPEYIYLTPEGSILPDNKNYGIAYVPLDVMETILNRRGEVNDICVTFEAGVTYEQMKQSLKDELSPGGLVQLMPRKDQNSHSMLETELMGIQSMVSVVPLVFLMLGALVMSVIVKRMVEQQHEQIGLLKAFGYSYRAILLHYAMYGVVIGLLASIIGGLLGALVADAMSALYTSYFVMPGITGAFSLGKVFQLAALALAFGVGASLYGARGVLRLGAAEAMRPQAPKSCKPIIIEKFASLWKRLDAIAQMSLRNLFRARSRSIMTLFGIGVCYALTVAVFAFGPMVDYMMLENFTAVQRYDLKVSLAQMAPARAVEQALENLNGVGRVEAVLELPLTVRKGGESEDTVLMALPEGAELYRMYNKENEMVALPRDGLVLTFRLAEQLNVKVGDTVKLDIQYPERQITGVVAALSEQYTSNFVIASIPYISSIARIGDVATSALLKVDGAEQTVARMKERLNEAQNVSSVMDVVQVQANMNELIQTSMSMLYFMAVMAVFAGFAIVYNASVVILSERTRELASMRVLGFTLGETVRVVAIEQLLLVVFGMIAGLPLAGYTMEALSGAIASDLFTIPTNIPLSSHITSIVCMLLAWLAAMWVTARKVRRTSMADVLKGGD